MTQAVLNEYEVLPKHMARFWSVFNKLDTRNIGYVTVEQILRHLSEREYSVVAPFCYRFFELIDKELNDRASFQELVVGLIYFCTFTRQEVIAFVFNLLDADYNHSISKTDIFKFLMQNREGYRVYPQNVTRSVELYPTKRGDKIDFMEFAEMVNTTCQFIVFPAFRLQSLVKERFGGFSTWSYINKKLSAKESNFALLQERDKFLQRSEQLKEQVITSKLRYYQEKREEWYSEYHYKQTQLRSHTRQLRVHKRRASDGFLGVNMPALFSDHLTPIQNNLEQLVQIYKEAPAVDAPILRKRLHQSQIWDRYSLVGLEDVDLYHVKDRGELMQENFDKMKQLGKAEPESAQQHL